MSILVPIGDFSRMTHLSVKALRFYHDQGLLEPARIDPATDYRFYDPRQVPVAQVIRRFRDLDMPLDQVKAVLRRGYPSSGRAHVEHDHSGAPVQRPRGPRAALVLQGHERAQRFLGAGLEAEADAQAVCGLGAFGHGPGHEAAPALGLRRQTLRREGAGDRNGLVHGVPPPSPSAVRVAVKVGLMSSPDPALTIGVGRSPGLWSCYGGGIGWGGRAARRQATDDHRGGGSRGCLHSDRIPRGLGPRPCAGGDPAARGAGNSSDRLGGESGRATAGRGHGRRGRAGRRRRGQQRVRQ